MLQRLERSTSIANFFLELQDILDKVNPPSKPDLFSVESCNAILCDLAKLGWENVKSISGCHMELRSAWFLKHFLGLNSVAFSLFFDR